MEFVVKARNPTTRQFIEYLMPKFIDQLGLKNSKKFVLVEVSRTCAGKNNEGITVPLHGLNTFVVAIRLSDIETMGVTLAHEMVHVKQMARGTLKSKNGFSYWHGKRYPKKAKYLYVPWEIEAFAKQELMFRRAVEIDKKNKFC